MEEKQEEQAAQPEKQVLSHLQIFKAILAIVDLSLTRRPEDGSVFRPNEMAEVGSYRNAFAEFVTTMEEQTKQTPVKQEEKEGK